MTAPITPTVLRPAPVAHLAKPAMAEGPFSAVVARAAREPVEEHEAAAKPVVRADAAPAPAEAVATAVVGVAGPGKRVVGPHDEEGEHPAAPSRHKSAAAPAAGGLVLAAALPELPAPSVPAKKSVVTGTVSGSGAIAAKAALVDAAKAAPASSASATATGSTTGTAVGSVSLAANWVLPAAAETTDAAPAAPAGTEMPKAAGKAVRDEPTPVQGAVANGEAAPGVAALVGPAVAATAGPQTAAGTAQAIAARAPAPAAVPENAAATVPAKISAAAVVAAASASAAATPQAAAPAAAPALVAVSGLTGPQAAPATAATAAPAVTAPPLAAPAHDAAQTNAAALAASVTAMVRDGTSSVTVRLDPPDLGQLSIHVAVGQDAKVNVLLIAAVPQTAQAFSAGADDLRQAFAGAGLSLGQLNVGGGGAGSQQSRQAPRDHVFDSQPGQLGSGNSNSQPLGVRAIA
jgi:flagellar hook-length control protein FliK